MFKAAATASAIVLALAGCASDPFEGFVRPRPSDEAGPQTTAESPRVKALMRVAAATASAGDLPNAAAMYRRANELEPRNTEVLNRLGEVLLHLGEYDEAARVYRDSASVNDNPASLHGLAKALIALDQPRAAISQLEAALKIEERVSVYNTMGVAYDLLGDHGAAQAYYRTGLDVDPESTSIQNNLGLSLAVAGRHEEAIAILRRLASRPGATPRNRLNLALAYGLAGDMEAAAQTARIDLDESSVQQNLAFYAMLRRLNDSRQTIRAIGAHNASLNARVEPVPQASVPH